MKVWLDDIRDPRGWLPSVRWFRGRDVDELGEWTWARTAPEAIALLEGGTVDEVSLDHDLGDEPGAGDGYDILLWIGERTATDDSYRPPTIHVHTSNACVRDRMESAVHAIEAMVERGSVHRPRNPTASVARSVASESADQIPKGKA